MSTADAGAMLSRVMLDELVQQVTDDGPDTDLAPHLERFRGAAIVVATAAAEVVVTDVRTGDVRRVEVWLAPTGAVALPVQSGPDVAGPIVALAPPSAAELLASAMGCSTTAVAAQDPVEVPGGLIGLVEQVVAGDRSSATATVIDWADPGRSERWLVLDDDGGRVASLTAPASPSAPVVLEPLSPMALAVALCDRVTARTTPSAS